MNKLYSWSMGCAAPHDEVGWKMKMSGSAIGAILSLAAVMLGASCTKTSAPYDATASARETAADTALLDSAGGDDWPAYGRTYGEGHYSPLDEVDPATVSRLGLAWSLDLPAGNTVTQPLAVKGILYFTVGNSAIHAVDAAAGKELWTFDPKANEAAGPRMRTSWGSRGLGYWNGKVYTGTVDGRLIAVDARTGKQVWSQQTLQDGDLRYITGAPRIFDGKVIIGHGGADSADIRGYVTTYDAETGKQLWRFYTVPGDPKAGPDNAASDSVMAAAAKTWAGEWWKYGGGGNAWNAFTYDKDTDTILIGTGNGAPWNHKIRSAGKGDNLFVCSILALDAKTGRYKWHYQVNPGETWDYNASMDMHLADLRVNGKPVKAIVTAPKNGFLYVIDRTNGRLISAEKFARVTWASQIDLGTGRPVEAPGARFPDGKPFELWPTMSGAHTNLPSAFSPSTGLIYIPVSNFGATLDDRGIARNWQRTPGGAYDFGLNIGPPDMSKRPMPSSMLLAWNPVTGKPAWQVPTPRFWNGGLMTTGGNLVFQGQADGKFNAYDATSGRRVWTFAAQGAVLAPPITYKVGGRQYVTVLTGSGLSAATVPALLAGQYNYRTQERRVLTFALDGKAKLPPPTKQEFVAFEDPYYKPTPKAESRGAIAFSRCAICHGAEADGRGGLAPDLRTSQAVLDPGAFQAIVGQGALVALGMPRFQELTTAEREAIRQYIRQRAKLLRTSGATGL